MRRKGSLVPLAASDIPATGRLFLKIFRGLDADGSAEFNAYLRAITLEAPSYSEELGSLVYKQPDGRIRSAILAVPMQFAVQGRAVTGRLLCAFMTDGRQEGAGAADITLTLRAKRQDFSFSDSASPLSQKHLAAVGGIVVPLQNLEWTRVFRPLGAFASRLEQKLPRLRRLALPRLAGPLDALIRAMSARASFAPPVVPGLTVEDMPREVLLDHAPDFVAHYAVRPLWSRRELSWLLDMAALNTGAGPLRMRAMRDPDGRLVGGVVYYGDRGRPAEILNVLARQGRETEILGAMFHDLDRAGCLAAVGRTQAALMPGLVLQNLMTFRHKAFVCINTRHPEVIEAAARGDVYLGGLAGEGWSRLMSDFR